MDPTARDDILTRYGSRRRELVRAKNDRETELPVRLLRQTSHFTTPASKLDTIEKAAAGVAGAARLLGKLEISAAELANALGCTTAHVEELLRASASPSLVMVDGEDATALDPAVLAQGRKVAVQAFTTIDWKGALAFYRPSGLELDSCIDDLVTVISETAERRRDRFPIDGVVWPKATHEEELYLLDDLLGELEKHAGLARRSIKVAFLVESGRALARLERLVDAILPRLCGVIWGSADYAADVGLPRSANDHPAFDRARSIIVNLAGAVGVPAIDSMTFEYPVRDPALDATANRARILGAMKRCFDDARHGIALGLEGKWVGHPLQLIANELAYRTALDPASVARDVAEARAYQRAVEAGLGAAAIGGAMADRATDRHVRRRLRRALAWGVLDVTSANELGVR